MANITPVWANYGYDSQLTQRSYVPLNLSNLSLYYSHLYSGGQVLTGYNGRGSQSISNAGITISTYNNEEYTYVGAGMWGAGNASILFATKTNLLNNDGSYNLIETTLYPNLHYYNKIRNSIVTSPTGTPYIISGVPAFEEYSSLSRIFRTSGEPSEVDPLTIGTTEGFTSDYFKYQNPDYLGKNLQISVVPWANIVSFDGLCYAYDSHLFQFDPDNINVTPNKGVQTLSAGDSNYGTYILIDPDASAGSYHKIYVLGMFGYYLFRNDNISNYVKGLDGNQNDFWGGWIRGATFKRATSESNRWLYVTINKDWGDIRAGVVAFDKDLNPISSILQRDYPANGGPALASDGTIYYRAGRNLYAISNDGSGNLSEKHVPFTELPYTDANTAAPIIDGSGRIIICSNTNTVGTNNVHIFEDSSTHFTLVKSFRVPAALTTTPSIGSTGMLYILGNNTTLYVYGSPSAPYTTTTTTPTTTTTTTTPGTTTTTTTGTATTTTTTPTTTTTTTTPPPLAVVQTTLFEVVNNQALPLQTSNASDDATTQNSLLSQSFTFGTIAPNETSKTLIVALNVPRARAITNIRLGLVSVDGIEFANNIFGYNTSVELRDDITPDYYFLGVNTDRDSSSIYNVSIPNRDSRTSEYVYLNVKLPKGQIIGEGIVHMKWWFDYTD